MPFLHRLLYAFAAAILPVPPFSLLILVCADMAGSSDCTSPDPGWLRFAATCALAVTIPAAAGAFSPAGRHPLHAATEFCRTVLLCFAALASTIPVLAGPVARWLQIPMLMLPTAASWLSCLAACPLAMLSAFLIGRLLPVPGGQQPAGRLRVFEMLSTVQAVIPLLPPICTQGRCILAPLPFEAVLFLILSLQARSGIMQGAVLNLPLWGLLSAWLLFRAGQTFTLGGPADALAAAAAALSVLASCAVLLHETLHEASARGAR